MGVVVTFDTTISIGNIAEVVSIILGGILVVFRMGGDIRVMKADMSNLKDTVNALTGAFDKLGTILTQVAVQDTRIAGQADDVRRLEARIDELAHGRGFVSAINREYP